MFDSPPEDSHVTRIALATAIDAYTRDEDLPPLQEALTEAGLMVDVRAWDDSSVSWARYDAVLLRSTWNYIDRLPQFLDWCAHVAVRSTLLNPLDVVRWNTDKRYLGELAKCGVPVIESHFLTPDDDPSAMPVFEEFVVKPTVGAGARGARRFASAEREQAIAHATELQKSGSHVLVQPYVSGVDRDGETALLYFDGRFSHAIRKAPLLRPSTGASTALFAAERITARVPSPAERGVADAVLKAVRFGPLAYARVDLLPGNDGPQLLELELTEPSLFFATAPTAAARFAESLRVRLQRDQAGS